MAFPDNKIIMIGSPIRNREKILNEYLESIYNIDYPKESIHLYWIINNSNSEVKNIIKNFKEKNEHLYASIGYSIVNTDCAVKDINCCRLGFDQIKFYDTVSDLRNRMRSHFLQSGADFLFSIDSDVLVTPDSLRKLISHNKDCVAGLVKNNPFKNDFNYLSFNKELKRFYRKINTESCGIIKVDLTGAAVLLSRDILSRCFYYVGKSGSDEGFALEAMNNGFEMFVDCDLRFQHVYDVEKGVRI